MRTERRHELQTNELADYLGKWIERVKPYRNLCLGMVVAVVVIVGAIMILNTQAAQREKDAWPEYFRATTGTAVDLEALSRIADDHPGTQAEQWSTVSWADARLQSGVDGLVIDRAQSTKNLQSAVDAYRRLQQANVSELIHQRATLGLARAYESLGELDKARKEYRQVTGAFQAFAQQRAKELELGEAKEFYDWFASAERATPSLDSLPGNPGQRPDFSLNDAGLPFNDGASEESSFGTENFTITDSSLGDASDPVTPVAPDSSPGEPESAVPPDDRDSEPEGEAETPSSEPSP